MTAFVTALCNYRQVNFQPSFVVRVSMLSITKRISWMGHGICGKVPAVMQRNSTSHISRLRSRSLIEFRVYAAAFALAAVVISSYAVVPFAASAESSLSDLERAEADLLREIDAAQQREAETARREAARDAMRAQRIAEKQRRIAEENQARKRAKEETIQTQIAREIELQDEMLRRRDRNETAQTRDVLGAHADSIGGDFIGDTQAALAPEEPELRDLPRAIFSEKSITIGANTPGFDNKKKRKLIKLTLDADGDGKPEVVRFVDRKTDVLVRQEEDRDYDGRTDSVLRFARGELAAREIDTNNDGRPDIWEQYKNGRQVERNLDRDYTGTPDAFYEFEGKYLARERHDADNDGKIDLWIKYKAGRRALSEEDRDRDGRVDSWTRYGLVDGRETVTRIELDKSGRGFADTFESFEANNGKNTIVRREEDLDGDGEIDIVSIYRLGKLVRREILKPEVVNL
ncbi:MAG: hypothetical protein QMC73_00605 [Myxococcota bacterium]|jgi:hypothetical protein